MKYKCIFPNLGIWGVVITFRMVIYIYINECMSVCSLCTAKPIELKLYILIAHSPTSAQVQF